MSELITIARPYAVAVFDEAVRGGDLAGWSDMLKTLATEINDTQIQSLITSPRLPKPQLESLIFAVAGDKLSAQKQNFLRLLIENHRLLLLSEIFVLFEAMRAEAEKVVDVTVTSAFELSEEQKKKIGAALRARMSREIRLSCSVDKALLGGVIIRAGDRVIDGSAKSRLAELTNALA